MRLIHSSMGLLGVLSASTLYEAASGEPPVSPTVPDTDSDMSMVQRLLNDVIDNVDKNIRKNQFAEKIKSAAVFQLCESRFTHVVVDLERHTVRRRANIVNLAKMWNISFFTVSVFSQVTISVGASIFSVLYTTVPVGSFVFRLSYNYQCLQTVWMIYM